jgi:amidase
MRASRGSFQRSGRSARPPQRIQEAFGSLLSYRAAARYGPFVDQYGGGPGIQAEVAAGRAVTAEQLMAAEAERDRLVRSFDSLFDEVDLLVTPAFGSSPWPASGLDPEAFGRLVSGWPLAWLVSLSGCPSVCLPAGRTAAGHPVGLQLIGPRQADVSLLRAARAVEQAIGFGVQIADVTS